MGLRQGDSSHSKQHVLRAWYLPAAALGIAAVLEALGESGRQFFSFDRPAIQAGELWRLVTGHFVHLGASHLLLNAAGLALVWYLIGDAFGRRDWLVVTLIVILGIDLGFWFNEPQLLWYVGLSGLLHGLLAAGIVGALGSGGIDIRILAVAVIAKLVYEQLVGPLPGSEASTGGAVIVNAHAYGALAGAIAGLVLIRVRRQARI